MDPNKQSIERIRELFSKALEVPAGKNREEFLTDACGDDGQLRKEIESLLKAYETTGGFLRHDASGEKLISGLDLVGITIGHYHIIQLLGEGGFGEVYRAEQTEPLKREVALKIVKLGMDTKEVLARFEAERQALARMEHPNIAQVYDAGVTNTGRPYFVMELVRGVPFIAYCDERRMSLPERLRLFRQVCDGVQHAHQKGILHRDLKPSNILVSQKNETPLPKVIDFGVAKSLQGRLTEQTLVTRQEAKIGTPLYMSPEQLVGDAGDTDTRADIYSLGVILYELLAGVTPLYDETSCPASLSEIKLSLFEREVPRPSKLLHARWDKIDAISADRELKPQALEKLLRGDLDWVVMKAMEKDRDRRYSDVGELARDIDHYLKHEPVSAGPPGIAYRTRKFVRRHRVGLAASLCIIFILVPGAWISTISLLRAVREAERARIQESRAMSASERAQQQEQRADQASERARKQKILAEESQQVASHQSERAAQEAERAESKQALAEATFGFLTDELLLRADPAAEPDRDIKLRTVVDQAAERLEHYLNDQPLEKGRIHQMLATLYLRLAEYDKARKHADEAVRLLGGELGPNDPKTLACLHDQAEAMFRQGQCQKAEVQLGKVLEARRNLLGDEDPETLQTMRSLTVCLYAQDQCEEAEKQFLEIMEIQERKLGPEHPELLQTSYNLAMVLSGQEVYQKAEEIHRDVLAARRRVLGPGHPDTLRSRRGLTQSLYGQGKLEEAEKLQRDSLGYLQRVMGPEHPDTLDSIHDLVKTLCAEHKWSDAEPLMRKLLEFRQQELGTEHPMTLQLMRQLAGVLDREGMLDEAEQLCRRLFDTWTNIRGADHPETLDAQHALANILQRRIKYEEAEQLAKNESRIRAQMQGLDHPDTLAAMELLASILYDRGKYRMAEQYYRRAVQIRSTSMGDEAPETLAARYRLALVLINPQSSFEAEQILRETLLIQQPVLGETHPQTLQTMGVLASVLRTRDQDKEADALDQQILELHRQTTQLPEKANEHQ